MCYFCGVNKLNMMTILNLDPSFTPMGEGIKFNRFSFPSGCEPHIKLLEIPQEKAYITCRIKSSEDILILMLAADALKRSGAKELSCVMPYLPFARQDRVMVDGEPLSIKVFANLINSIGFKAVEIFDPHSEVGLALIENSIGVSNHFLVTMSLLDKQDFTIVSPDAGAYKKIFKLCQELKYEDAICLCNKTRDVSNGNITGVTCDTTDFNGKDLYIIDDICDGGGTFVLLANELRKRNCGKINLIVTHGIFSKGIEALEGIDHIYTTDSFKDYEPNEKLTVFRIKNYYY